MTPSRPIPSTARRFALFLVPLALLLPTLPLLAEWTQDEPVPAPTVVQIRLAMPIHPIAADHLDRALEHAVSIDAAALVIELDTPGGSLPATRRMAQALLSAPVPVIVWVGPAGAQAASAGFFLLLAADVAAMAPGTNTGAAHPVGGGGEDIEGAMGEKVEQDTLALVRSLAERHGRDLEMAQAAVSQSRSFTASEAVELGLADLEAATVADLLTTIDGRTIERPGQAPVRLASAGASVTEFELPASKRLLAALAHPQIAGMLMALGLLGLYVEISNPGLILPGTFGAIALILAFFALSVLPINTAGFALLALALVLFVAETQVPTFGVLTIGGAVAMVLGLSMLFEDLGPSMRPHPASMLALGLTLAAIVGFLSYNTARLRRQRPTTGIEGMVGERGVVRSGFDRAGDDGWFAGRVFVHGESWRALAPCVLAGDHEVEIEAVDGLSLLVRPVHDASSTDHDTGSPAWTSSSPSSSL